MVNGSGTLKPFQESRLSYGSVATTASELRVPCIKRYGYGHHLSSMPRWCGINCTCFSRLSYHYVYLESFGNPKQQWPLLFSKPSDLVSCELHHRESHITMLYSLEGGVSICRLDNLEQQNQVVFKKRNSNPNLAKEII